MIQMVEVDCEECQTPFEALVAYRKRGQGRFCSRSCASTNLGRRRPKKGRKIYSYAELKDRYGERYAVTSIVNRVQGRCREAGTSCDLTPTLFREMLESQEWRCFYTNRLMTLGQSTRVQIDPDQVSIDRKDSGGGYTVDNMVLCCWWVNSAKGQMSLEELLERARELVRNH